MFIINTKLLKDLRNGDVAAWYQPTGSNIDMLTCLLRTTFPNDNAFINTVSVKDFPYYSAAPNTGLWVRLQETKLPKVKVEDFFEEIEEEKIVITEEVLKSVGFEQAGEGLDLQTLKVNDFLHIGYSLRTKKLCVLKTSVSVLPVAEDVSKHTEEIIIHEIVIVRQDVEHLNTIADLYKAITDKKLI